MKNKDIRTYLFWAILGIFVGYVIFGRGSIKVDVKKYVHIKVWQKVDLTYELTNALYNKTEQDKLGRF